MSGARPAAAVLLALSAAFLLAACPDVDLSRWGSEPSGDASGAAAGPVTGIGSVKVAGAEFTDNVSTRVEDDLGRGIGDIVAGMAVTVRGTVASTYLSGTADSVAIERQLRGPVDDDGVALDNNSIRVLGQTVLVNPATVIVDADGREIGLEDLKERLEDGRRPGLEVHGGGERDGTIRAFYVGQLREDAAADDDVALRGTVAGLNAAARTFRIGRQAVGYAGLDSGGRIDWPSTGLADGLVVDVRGYIDALGGAGTLRVDREGDRVQVVSTDLGGSGDRVSLEGYVLSGSESSFAMSVPGATVEVTSGIVPTGDPFGPGKRVRVKGTLRGAGGAAVQATAVDVLKPFEVVLQGAPEGLPADGDTITLLGKTVRADAYTLYRDPAGGVREGFGLADLRPGDTVRAVGRIEGSDPSGEVLAARVDRVDASAGRSDLQGPVSSWVRDLSLKIAGLTVNTGSARIDYSDKGGVPLAGRDAFYDRLEALGAGTIVRVRNGLFVSASSRVDAPSEGDRMEVGIVTVNR